MNWNNTQFDGYWPITVRAAREVGNILKYLGYDEPLEASLRLLHVAAKALVELGTAVGKSEGCFG